jgi:cation transport regulator
MPYKSINDLPDTVRKHLPKHAKEIYMEAFNNAWREYKERQDREAVSHKVAWSAVKNLYQKQDGKWVRK